MQCTQTRSIREMDEACWDMVAGDVLQMTHRWLRAVEGNWRFYEPCYMLLEDEDGPYAAILANLSTAIEENFGWLGWLYQRFSLVLRPPFSSLCSVVVRPDLSLDTVMPDLNAALTQLCRREKRLLISVGNVSATNLSSWQKAGFQATRQPGVSVLDLPTTYEDYLASLPRKERQELRRIRKRAAEFDIRLEISALNGNMEEVYALLCEVYAKHGVSRDAMPFRPQFLSALALEMPQEVSLIRGYAEGKLVGVFLNLLNDPWLLGLMVGLHYKIARPSYLYFVIFDEMIRWSIQQGYQQAYVGRTNEREKRKYGFYLEDRWLCYRANIKPLQRVIPVAARLLSQVSTFSNE